MAEALQLRVHGDASLPTLIYLPGLHGDCTLVASFRVALAGRLRFVEFTYPRTLTWSLEEYAEAVEAALVREGIVRGWLLGESFGSQIVWQLVRHSGVPPDGSSFEQRLEAERSPLAARGLGPGFQVDGIILAGGFVKHPLKWGVYAAQQCCHGVSLTWLTRLLFCYAKFARFRHRHAPETLAGIREFVARRTELDKQAAVHRLRLVAASDPRAAVRQVRLPVYYLSGWFDPIVPWPLVRPWLRRNCPGYRASRIIWKADHTVLATAPKAAAAQVIQWLNGASPAR